jgi:hypothetical protein
LSTDSSTLSTDSSTLPESYSTTESNDEDLDLNLDNLCAGCSLKHLVANPNSQKRYIECNGGDDGQTNSVQSCSPGLLFDPNRLTCDYVENVNL